MTMIENRSNGSIPQADGEPNTKPTREDVIKSIKREGRVSKRKARKFLDYLELNTEIVRHSVVVNRWHLMTLEIMKYHKLLVRIMPDDKISQPGSAHAAIEAILLDPSQGELALVHTQFGEKIRYCAVAIQLRSAF